MKDPAIQHETYTLKNYLKFLIPSLIGIILFLTPIYYHEKFTISVAILAEVTKELFIEGIPAFMTVIFGVTLLLTLITKWFRPQFVLRNHFLKGLFDISYFWIVMRALGLIFAVLTLYQIGPEMVWSEDTGAVLLYDLVPTLTTIFVFAGLFLPLLLQFGLLELVGALMIKVMKPIFTLPGRSAIDCMASWVGDGSIGILLTNKQYEDGFYTKREAAVIATNFSVVSVTFSLVIISVVGLEHMFIPFYLTVLAAGVLAAIVLPRIPPLSRKKDEYYEPVGKQIDERIPKNVSVWKWGLTQALQQAKTVKGTREIAVKGIQNVLDMWIGVIPLVMSIGTIALIIAEYTPLFTYLGYPFVPILNVLQVPEAAQAAQTMVVGFADMFLPAVIGSGIESEMTRFVIASVSVTQLIYMSEVGVLLLRSKLGLNLLNLMIIFLLRTLVTLPFIVLVAHFLF